MLHVDLWRERDADPGKVIVEAVADALRLEAAPEREVALANEVSLESIRSLRPLQSAVLREMASMGRDCAPFEGEAMERYARTVRSIDRESTIVPSATNV